MTPHKALHVLNLLLVAEARAEPVVQYKQQGALSIYITQVPA
jgi:hypothetical protein